LAGNEQVQGLLGLSMTMLAKFRLGKLVGELTKEVEAYQKINEELIKKYGEEKDGSFVIMNFVEDSKTGEKTLNPNLEKYAEEINPILQEERELETLEADIQVLEKELTKLTEQLNAGIAEYEQLKNISSQIVNFAATSAEAAA
jgi:polyhydroxyalkanoate synthesis regulator phasin